MRKLELLKQSHDVTILVRIITCHIPLLHEHSTRKTDGANIDRNERKQFQPSQIFLIFFTKCISASCSALLWDNIRSAGNRGFRRITNTVTEGQPGA